MIGLLCAVLQVISYIWYNLCWLSCHIVFCIPIMFVKLCYWKYSGDQGPWILSSGAAHGWEAACLLAVLYRKVKEIIGVNICVIYVFNILKSISCIMAGIGWDASDWYMISHIQWNKTGYMQRSFVRQSAAPKWNENCFDCPSFHCYVLW
jgi:hypothetical protein